MLIFNINHSQSKFKDILHIIKRLNLKKTHKETSKNKALKDLIFASKIIRLQILHNYQRLQSFTFVPSSHFPVMIQSI